MNPVVGRGKAGGEGRRGEGGRRKNEDRAHCVLRCGAGTSRPAKENTKLVRCGLKISHCNKTREVKRGCAIMPDAKGNKRLPLSLAMRCTHEILKYPAFP
ncbi:hypothetical protein [Methylobacterium komagatae]|uniref:hypothetical protein n=1 Tax=Methylobacterium komagatae TaxID=374425 RepID=UPI00366B4594